MSDNKTRRQPEYPDIFGGEYEDESIINLPDGSQRLCKRVSFEGEYGEVFEELKKIVANWPTGMYEKGKFGVGIGVEVETIPPSRPYIHDLPIKSKWDSDAPAIFAKSDPGRRLSILANGAERLSDSTSGCGTGDEVLAKLKEVIANWPDEIYKNGQFHFIISAKVMLKGVPPTKDAHYQASVGNLESELHKDA